MQSAFAMIGIFPPPSPRSDILAGLHGACAGLTANAGVALVVELVIGYAMLMDIVPHLLLSPLDERIYLDKSVHVVPFHEVHVLTGHALLTSQSAHPHVESLHSPMQRFQLADLTTAMAALYRVIEKVDAFFSYHALYLVVVRKEYLYLNAILHVCAVDELIGLGKETAGIESKDTCCGCFFDDDVGEHLILDAQTGRKSDASLVVFQEIAQHLFRTLPFQLSIKACD